MTRRPAPPKDQPVLDPRNGLRQRQRANGTWRVWWEPTGAEAARGAAAVDLSAKRPGDAQREADRLKARWSGTPEPQAPRRGTLDSVIADYRASRHWARLRATTQASYAHDLKEVAASWGPRVVAGITAPEVDRWYGTLLKDKGPYRARALKVMLSIVLKHAVRLGFITANPCAAVEVEAPPRRTRRGTVAELQALLSAARRLKMRDMRAALMLVLYGGGQRQIDVLQVRPQDFSRVSLQFAGMDRPRPFLVWQLVRSKRGNSGALVVNPVAAPVLRLQLRLAARAGAPLIFNPATGKGYAKRAFHARWAALRAEAAKDVPTVETLQWRDLRRTFASLARAGGASVDDVGDAIGNTAARDDGLRETYMAAQLATTARATLAVPRLDQVRKAG